MSRVGLAAVASYLPERWMSAAEIGEASGIPEDVIVRKFGLRGKHVAAPDEHVSDMAATAAERALTQAALDPASVDVLIYFGSMWKDYPVWQVGPHIADRVGCVNVYAVEYANVSYGAPAALRVGRDMLAAEDELSTVLAVGASRESYLLDYRNQRSRFMINFGDGAAAVVLSKAHRANEVLGSFGVTDGSLSLQVKVPSGGSVDPDGVRRSLDVDDPAAMKRRLDEVSLPNFVRAAEGALARSGASLADIDRVCGIHMKRSMHEALIEALGVEPARAAYLDDAGHMSGVDPLLALDRALQAGELRDGDVILVLAAGTGYTWAATVVRWGEWA